MISTSAGLVRAPQSTKGGFSGSRLEIDMVPRLKGLDRVRGISEWLVKPVSTTAVAVELYRLRMRSRWAS